jgi:CubicO group peptidase (beta-lactamase class C family)
MWLPAGAPRSRSASFWGLNLLFLFILGGVSCHPRHDATLAATDAARDAGGWAHGSLESAGISPGPVESLLSELRADPRHDIKALLIARHGRLVSETYFNGADHDTLNDVRSAGKSITSLLLGIAIERGFVRSTEDSIARYFTGPAAKAKQAIRIQDLLTMRSGLAADEDDPASPGREDLLDRSSDLIEFALALPIAAPPGKRFVYASANAFLVGALIENSAHLRLDRFANRELFSPLGIQHFSWELAPHDRGVGQGNLSLTARDAAKLGQLVLNEGEFGGRRIVSASWIRESLAPRVPLAPTERYADAYGYFFWSKIHALADGPVRVHFASGSGGNKIYVVPQLDLVVVVVSTAFDHGYGHQRSHDALLAILRSTRRE